MNKCLYESVINYAFNRTLKIYDYVCRSTTFKLDNIAAKNFYILAASLNRNIFFSIV